MTQLPAAGTFNANDSLTQGELRQAHEDVRTVLEESPGFASPETLTISAGVVTPTRGFFRVDTESAASTDDLTNIALTNIPDGRVVWCALQDEGRVVTAKHAATGSGQLLLTNGVDLELNARSQILALKRVGNDLEEVARFGREKLRTPTLLNGFTAASPPPRNFLNQNGMVVSSGRIQHSSYPGSGVALFVFDVGLRPAGSSRHIIDVDLAPATIEVTPDGTATLFGGPAPGTTADVHLNFMFPAEQ